VANARVLVDAHDSAYGASHPLECRTDPLGRFRVVPYLGNELTVIAYPPAGEPYLLRARELTWPKAAVRQQVQLALPRGVLVRGMVTEASSGRPVGGATVEHEPFRDNNPFFRDDVRPRFRPWDNAVVSGPDGRFEIAVLPGPGHLLVKGPASEYLHQEISTAKLYGKAVITSHRHQPDGIVALDLKPDAGAQDVSVTLRRGVTIKGRLLGPDDKPIARALVFSPSYIPFGYDQQMVQPLEAGAGRFAIPGCDPKKPADVIFLDVENQLGAVARLSVKEGEETTVRLEPCGTARVRFVDGNGKPIVGGEVHLDLIVARSGSSKYNARGGMEDADVVALMINFDRKRYGHLQTDSEGRITFPTLIGGATYRILAPTPAGRGYATGPEFRAVAGKPVDLADIVAK
jgi:hypothetical protein